MIERYIYTALQSGLRLFAEQPALYNSLFGQLYGLSAKEVARIREGMERNPPKIMHTLSPEAARVPCYVIDVNNESQTASMLANSAGMVAPAGGAGGGQPLFTNFWRHQFSIQCASQQRDKTEYLYEIAKCSLYLQLLYLVKNGLDQVQLSGGPLREMPAAPERVFLRELSFTCIREFRFYPPLAAPILRSVDGLFILDERPNGGVNAQVTVASTITARN